MAAKRSAPKKPAPKRTAPKKTPPKKTAPKKTSPKKTAPKKTAPTPKVTGPASYFPSIEKKYGKPVAEWKKLIRSRYPARHMELVTWLKVAHGMGHGHANALVGHTLAEDAK